MRPACWLAIASTALLAGCAHGATDPIAYQNKVFYHYYDADADPSLFETRYPPLDLAAQGENPDYLGYTLVGGTIHISRPKNWVLRTASNKPEERFVEYISPNQYVFTIYERLDSPEDLWREVMGRYEQTTKDQGAELIGMRVPVATWNAQGRAYLVRRLIPGNKQPFRNMSREYLLRNEHRVVLVQVVFPSPTLAPVNEELMRVFETLELL